jgi:hypothetical protein
MSVWDPSVSEEKKERTYRFGKEEKMGYGPFLAAG